MKKIALLLLVVASIASSQLLTENFDYTAGTLLTANGWTNHSGTNGFITVNNGGLTYSGYSLSGIGNAALVDSNGEDVNKTFTTQTSGTLYYSFLLRVDAVGATGAFIHLFTNSTTFVARVYAQVSGGGFNLGLANGSTGSFGTTVYTLGTTYLCTVKYDVSTTGACSLWVFSSGVPADESSAGTAEKTNTGSGQASISAIALRQYTATQNYVIDGIRVGTTWNDAPLPVELTSFTAATQGKNVELKWNTATEVNNYGFEIERSEKVEGRSEMWKKVGFVEGAGTTNVPKSYSFVDPSATGKMQYRLKQIDRDGKFEYSNTVEAVVALSAEDYKLSANFPNPFNPATKISFAVPSSQRAVVRVFNMLGQEVATLFNGIAEANTLNTVEFNGKGLASGIYFYSLKTNNRYEVKKMLMTK